MESRRSGMSFGGTITNCYSSGMTEVLKTIPKLLAKSKIEQSRLPAEKVQKIFGLLLCGWQCNECYALGDSLSVVSIGGAYFTNDCYATGNVTSLGSDYGSSGIGGLFGGAGPITDCYATGSSTPPSINYGRGNRIGGLCGNNGATVIRPGR